MSVKPQQKAIAYYRVSTAKQGASGLGLEAQREAVRAWAHANNAKIVQPFEETESGKRAKHNPELTKAIAMTKRLRATLVIAKLDRLARNVAFVANLMESGVAFVACDMPQANAMTIHIIAAVAEAEAKAISERTKAALAAYKARGGLLGAANPGQRNFGKRPGAEARGREKSLSVRKKNLQDADEFFEPIIRAHLDAGLNYTAIAAKLNEDGIESRRGLLWSDVQVRRVLLRSRHPPPPIYRHPKRRQRL